MPCTKPVIGYRRSPSGGRLVFSPSQSFNKVPISLPCNRCLGCRMEKARQWGMRCLHEAKLHRDNVYVTLTYDDNFLPGGETLVKRDLQLFMKRLRKLREPEKVRFFAGGEYGEGNKRPHYHMLLFNCDFPDKRYHGRNARGEPLYTSAELRELWYQGFNTIGAVTFDSAVYCAKYALKKVNGDAAYEHYQFCDVDGVVYDREPEFALMSRRPGIASGYFEKYGQEVLDNDSVVINGKEVRPPRFYDARSEALDPVSFARLKKKRKRLEVLNRPDNTPARLAVKAELLRRAVEKKERKL